ncbi:hypothetical protein Cadr_000019024 [Camelus dromedarius]|uniref:Uncharacterized protein n=1 Tax=Camelus dromedarius TaxID=9838 RepID=A0A5N4D475_CAMDR|nr:hypothetical protein Cadr_000019024 [Camelus dromedarius]
MGSPCQAQGIQRTVTRLQIHRASPRHPGSWKTGSCSASTVDWTGGLGLSPYTYLGLNFLHWEYHLSCLLCGGVG